MYEMSSEKVRDKRERFGVFEGSKGRLLTEYYPK
jgi:hypothetical protein